MPAVPKIKLIRLKGKAKTAFRIALYDREGGLCQGCHKYAPLYYDGTYFHPYYCGHVSHIKSRGAGGADTMDNVMWHCFNCHRDWEDHTGRYKNR